MNHISTTTLGVLPPQCNRHTEVAIVDSSIPSKVSAAVATSEYQAQHPNKAIFDILDKSFESLTSSPLLPFNYSSNSEDEDPQVVLHKKETIIRIIMLCFASFAVTFRQPPSSSASSSSPTATTTTSIEQQIKATRLDNLINNTLTIRRSPASSVSSSSTHDEKQSNTDDAVCIAAVCGVDPLVTVPCEILFLLWELMTSAASIEITTDERKILQDYLSSTNDQQQQQQQQPSSISELAMHVLLSLGLIELVEKTTITSSDSSPCLRISHELNRSYGVHLSLTKLLPSSTSNNSTILSSSSSKERWNTILAQSLQRICYQSSCTASHIGYSGIVSANELYALERLPYHLLMSNSYRDVSCLLTQESFVNKRLATLGLVYGAKVHHQDIYIFYDWAIASPAVARDASSSTVVDFAIHNNNNNNNSISAASNVVISAYNQLSKVLFHEYETLERMNDFEDGQEERLLVQLGEAFHLLGTYYTALISTSKRRKTFCMEEEQIIVNISSDPTVINSLREEEMKHLDIALKLKYSYHGDNHHSVADTYLAIGSAHHSSGDAYKAMACYNHASDIYKLCLGPNSLQFAESLFVSGVIYLEARELETSLECLEECLLIRGRSSDDDHSTDNADTLQYIGRVYREMGKAKEAMKYFKASLWAKENIYGKDHLEVAASYCDMANLFLSKGDYEAAVQFYQKALLSRQNKLGYDHELVGETIGRLARVHKALGHTTNAITCLDEAIRIEELKKNSSPSSLLALYEEAVPLLQAQYGPDDATVSASLQSMAFCHEKLNSLDQALKFYEDALQIRREVADHSNIATILFRIGIINARKSKYPEALSCFDEALTMRTLTLGDDDIEVANVLHNIGNTLVKMKQLEAAKTAFAEVLRIRKMHLGRDHISVGNTLHNMGNIQDQLGDLQSSILCYEHALRIRKKHQTKENSLVLSFTLHNLAQVYLKKDGNAFSERALELLSEALSIRKKKFGESHELVGDTIFYIGRVYDLHGDDQALQYFNEAKKIYETSLGTMHTKVAEVYDFLGSMYEARSEYEEACSQYEKSLNIKSATLGENSMPFAETLYNLGSVFAKKGDDDKMLMYYKEALRVMKTCVGKNDLRVGIILNDVGIIQARRGHHDIALKCLGEALRIRKILRGNSHEDIADTLFNIGNVHQDLLDYDPSLKYFKEALDMYKSFTGVDSLDVGNTLHQLGECCRMKKNFELATKYYKDALEIRTLKLGIDDLDVAVTLNCLGLLQHETENLEAAIEFYDEAIRIRRLALGDHHLLVAESIFNKGSLFALRQENGQAMVYYAECLEIYQNQESSINVAKTLAGIGCIYEAENEEEQAITRFEEALAIRIEHFGQNNESVAELLLNIGCCHLSIGNYEKSTSVLEEALRILKSVSENDNVDMLSKTIDAIGRVYDAQSKHDDALVCYRESLRLRRRTLGNNHLSVADSFDLMATVYQTKCEFNHAIRCIKEALAIRKENLGDHCVEIGNTLFGMGIVLCEAGQYAESVSFYKQALIIREQCLGESSIEVAKTLHNIGSVLALTQDYADALTNWKNALSIYTEAGMDNDDEMVKCALGNIAMAEHLLLEAGPDTGMM